MESEENIMGLIFLTYHRGDALFGYNQCNMDCPHNNKNEQYHQCQGKAWDIFGRETVQLLVGTWRFGPFELCNVQVRWKWIYK